MIFFKLFVNLIGILKVFILLLVLYCTLPLLFWIHPDLIAQSFFQAEGISENRDPSVFNFTGRNLYLSSAAGLIPVWLLSPNKTLSKNIERDLANEGNIIIYYIHGVRYDRLHINRRKVYAKLLNLGYYVVALDYQGFCENTGEPHGRAAVENVKSVFRWLKSYTGKNLVVWWGHSAGTGIASKAIHELQDNYPIDAFIFESGFSSFKSMLINKGVFKWLFNWWAPVSTRFLVDPVIKNYELSFDNIFHLQKMYCPILHIHADNDKTVDFSEAQAIYSHMHWNDLYKSIFVDYMEKEESHYVFVYDDAIVASIRDFILTVKNYVFDHTL